MKILFITGQYSENNANSNCLNNLIDVMKYDNEIDVVMLGKEKSVITDSGINKITLDCENSFSYNVKNALKARKGIKSIFEIIAYTSKKVILKTCLSRFFPEWFCNAERFLSYEQLKNIIVRGNYDCIVSISFPFKCHYLSYIIKKEFKNIYWCAYYLDPYSFNATNKFDFKLCKKLENKVLSHADGIVLTKKMHGEFSSCELKKHLSKAVVCEFPNVKNHNIKEKNHAIEFDSDCINCVFVGYLYSKIRDPRFFLDILSSSCKNIKFYIVGGFGGKKDEFNLNTDNLKDRVEIIPPVSLNEAFNIMNDADILINIGNSVSNQLPSKIFDYVSTGKPIVNIYKTPNCPTLEYMEKYPLALNIYEGDGISGEMVSKFESFCQDNKGKSLAFDTVKELYKTSTPECIASKFGDLFRSSKHTKRIVGINSVNYGSTGGIMIGALNCASKAGHEVYASFGGPYYNKNIDTPNPIPIIFKQKIFGLDVKLQKRTGLMGCFSYAATYKFLKKLDKINPDVLHLHNLHGWYINLYMLFKWIKKHNVKVIWTLHDCWAFTGQCAHFEYEKCEKWKSACYGCPKYREYPDTFVDRTKIMYKLKKRWFTGVKDLTIVTPSQWLANLVKQSYLKEYKVEVINSGIDLQVFKPTKSNLRDELNLADKRIILGCAFPFTEKKGFDTFLELARMLDDSYHIVLVGLTKEQIDILPYNIIGIEKTSSKEELAKYYTMADVFVNPTKEEVLGLVNIESLACGTPVITFNTGGSPECIDETCGIVVPQNDVTSLKESVECVCNSLHFDGNACVKYASNFDKTQKFEQYVDLYD